MASIKRPNLDLKMGYTGGVQLPSLAEAGFAAYVNAEGKNLQYVRSSGTTNQRPSSPSLGWTYYDTTIVDLIVYNGSAWESVQTGDTV